MKGLSHYCLFSVILSLLVPACGSDNFPEYVYLKGLRVVAMPVSQPEVLAGATITVSPLISDIGGNGRTLSYTAKACKDPGLATNATITCDGAEEGLNTSGTFSISGPEYVGKGPVLTAKVPATFLANRSAADQLNGVIYLVIFKITAPDGKTLETIKRIFVTGIIKQPKNSNPIINEIQVGDLALKALPTQATDLNANIPAASEESYSSINSEFKSEIRTETVFTTWFVTDGTLNRYRSTRATSVTWTPPSSAPSDRKVTIIAVTRDGRGGESYVMKSF